MPSEDKNKKNPAKYSARTSLFSFLWLYTLWQIDSLLVFFSLRKKRQFWGIVYDSVTKQPLDPVIVKLLYVDGSEVETGVTDLAGRYGFLAKPGKFKIFVKKTNYLFPSKYAAGDSDGIYDNLYHGEFFELYGDYDVVAPNVPMDPENFDWNQQAKKELVNNHPYLKKFFKKLVAVMFWFGLIFLILGFWLVQKHLYPWYGYLLLCGYGGLLILALFTPTPRLWGKIKSNNKNLLYENLFLELHNEKFTQISFGKAWVTVTGKFLLRANPGRYILSVSKVDSQNQKVLLAETKISIGKAGVFNPTLYLKEK
ncbi:MAG: hypothetical protein HY918_02405 [Candidatus Doudnabacteria bacterium]|nr:hypothetical protein [Candidatus Doudnabacteria bacterium]